METTSVEIMQDVKEYMNDVIIFYTVSIKGYKIFDMSKVTFLSAYLLLLLFIVYTRHLHIKRPKQQEQQQQLKSQTNTADQWKFLHTVVQLLHFLYTYFIIHIFYLFISLIIFFSFQLVPKSCQALHGNFDNKNLIYFIIWEEILPRFRNYLKLININIWKQFNKFFEKQLFTCTKLFLIWIIWKTKIRHGFI